MNLHNAHVEIKMMSLLLILLYRWSQLSDQETNW